MKKLMDFCSRWSFYLFERKFGIVFSSKCTTEKGNINIFLYIYEIKENEGKFRRKSEAGKNPFHTKNAIASRFNFRKALLFLSLFSFSLSWMLREEKDFFSLFRVFNFQYIHFLEFTTHFLHSLSKIRRNFNMLWCDIFDGKPHYNKI